MSGFIAIQLLRTKEHRATQKELYEKNLQGLLDKMPKEQAEGYEVRSNEKMVSIEHAMFMFNPDVIATFSQALVNHIWLIGVNSCLREKRWKVYSIKSRSRQIL